MTKAQPAETLLGFPVSLGGIEDTVDQVVQWVRLGQRARCLACINPHSYVIARADAAFADALRAADWLIPDGVGIVLASRALGGAITERVTGSDIFEGVHARLEAGGGSVFFLGASDATLLAMCQRMQRDHPGVRVAGTYSPPFKPSFSEQDIDAMVAAVNAAAPDVLWVGMTSPKQDLWLRATLPRLRVRFAAGVGAVFDFYAGHVKRSPAVFRKLGLEWLPRFLQEPRRLWRRMFISAPIFLWDVACAAARRRWGATR
jgi:N-acetylglucosaminyldiphosphoundecaprenol N-acetyl-beta-D-mannosaminyltransferase